MLYAQPKDIAEAVKLLGDGPEQRSAVKSDSAVQRDFSANESPADFSQPWTILAGGTDFYPAMLEGPRAARVLDIHALSELKRVEVTDAQVRIGAGVTWSDIIKADLPPSFDALKLAAREIGSVQIQNKATLAGNLCNASPAADGVPALLVLDAQVELVSRRGTRQLALADFILGNRKTAKRVDELLTAIIVPSESCAGRSTFLKLGARKYLVISISMVAVRLECNDEGQIQHLAIAVGSCSEVARRLVELEKNLLNCHLSELSGLVSASNLDPLTPIADVRSSAKYRMDASLELVKRALNSFGSLSS